MAIEIKLTLTKGGNQFYPSLTFRGPHLRTLSKFEIYSDASRESVVVEDSLDRFDHPTVYAQLKKLLVERETIELVIHGGQLDICNVLRFFGKHKFDNVFVYYLMTWCDELQRDGAWLYISSIISAGYTIELDGMADGFADGDRYTVSAYDSYGEHVSQTLLFLSSSMGDLRAELHDVFMGHVRPDLSAAYEPGDDAGDPPGDKWYLVSIAMPDDLSMRGLPAKANWLLTSSQYDALKSNAPEEVRKNMHVTEVSADDVAAYQKRLAVVRDAIASAEM